MTSSQCSKEGLDVQPNHLTPTWTGVSPSLTFLQRQHLRCVDLYPISKGSPISVKLNFVPGSYIPSPKPFPRLASPQMLFQLGFPAPKLFPTLLLCDPRARSLFIPDEPMLERFDRTCGPVVNACFTFHVSPSLTLCTPVALAAIVEAIPRKAVRRRDIEICTGTGRSTVFARVRFVSSLGHGAESVFCRPVFAAGTRLQERRTRRNIRLDEDKAPVSLIDRVMVLACAGACDLFVSPTKGTKGQSRTRGEGRLTKGGNRRGSAESERKQETESSYFCFLRVSHFSSGLLLRSHEPRACTDETGVREKGGRRR